MTPPTREQSLYADISSHDGINIDVEDLSESEWREARELVGEDEIAADDSRIPPRFRPGTPFVIVGAAGRLDAEVSAFGSAKIERSTLSHSGVSPIEMSGQPCTVWT